MKIDTKELIEQYFDQAVESTKELIKIPSVESKPVGDKPFGFGVHDALEYIVKLTKKLGFNPVKDDTNKYAYFDFGTGKDIFAILCHLDVVPAGDLSKWFTGPFDPIIKDNKLIGRGSFDDKGPTMMNVYAVKYLKDKGFNPSKYTIRVIFGLNEETNWKCMEKYVADHGYAKTGYVPDGLFPCVYAEKWISTVEITSNVKPNFEIKAGQAVNMVCDVAEYTGDNMALLIEKLKGVKNISTQVENGVLVVKGLPGHASVPFVGVNAATYLANALYELGNDHPLIKFVATQCHLNFSMSKVFGDISDETGDLTQNIGLLNINNEESKVTINFRVPVFTNPENDLLPVLDKKLKEYNLGLNIHPVTKAIYIPKDSELVTTMVDIYQQVTGDMNAKPQSMGGGTYAKTMPNIIAFGAAMDIENASMHAYNEYVAIDHLKKMLEIYTKAIYKLTK
ncbi:Sapep family Mn(2+)-dependent dipeptidase [Mesoplasma corruscae]|uniref:Dipeptidase PepV n=1 Tax=Mesoplasma corruscae TaxID=216874 RepID=A0A2S5RFZ8_9MOLU|nr:Sapep family Mn(2+)-dependent dipeptidase [Mesoplasma corruscae]PPE06217.1 dipeptidase PepV [Mesoplasma corruscae]